MSRNRGKKKGKRMKKRIKLFVLLHIILIASMLIFGCKGKIAGPEGTSASETLVNYLTTNSLDLPDILNGWIIAAADVNGNEGNYYIMDIRSAADFATGHITGAVNSTFGNIVTDAANSGGKTIIVTCYTGQSAAHAVVALRLSGYADAKSLKFGMSSWNAAFGRWTANTGNIAGGHANWTTDATATVADFAYPEINTAGTEGAAILTERVAAMLAGGFRGISATDVLNTPTNYFINNYWAEVDVATYGHIVSAYRINPLTLANDEIKNLNPDETIVTYCWTGQTSSIITAYLTVLGYDATSLKFGANAMIYDDLAKSKWSASGDYAFVQ